ncbi:MAG: glycine--tRNA ligase subunit beta [Acidobacteriota bacterium]|nr:glycine--tRNA ligase subunit beta [Acidobacteriota bacterium]
MSDFLLEIGTEEIPARMIAAAEAELARRVQDVIQRERLGGTTVETYSTPRRLAVVVHGVAISQADSGEVLTGPSVDIAYKDGQPTKAALRFAEKAGVTVQDLGRATGPKGEYVTATTLQKGRGTIDILREKLPPEIGKISWPKAMRWRSGIPERFVRPVRWIVAMLDAEVVPITFGGITAWNKTRGHRVLSSGDIIIAQPTAYADALAGAKVVATRKEREHRIRKALDATTHAVEGLRWREDAALLSTAVDLTEFPSVIMGSFDKEFLALPEEVLVTVMRDHQKYFAVEYAKEDANGKLAPHFLAVLNTDGDPEGLIRHGNERVLRARFNDARFFWQTDQKTPLNDRVEMLKAVTFQKDLGSYHDKAKRVSELANEIAADLAAAGSKLDRDAVNEAAWLAKTDLTTELVKEFTELQGKVGGLYAKAQKHSQHVADAVYDQYKPESMEDAAPRTLEGAALAIADKADSIAGMFALGNIPSGSRDPFALRRAANGIVKTIAEHKLPLDLKRLFQTALAGYKGSEAEKKFRGHDTLDAISGFMRERLEFYLREARGFAYDAVAATLAVGADDIGDAIARTEAVASVRPSADFEAISVSFKRMKNILRQAEEAGKKTAHALDPDALKEPAEKALAANAQVSALRVASLKDKQQYAQAMAEISKLRPPIDAFFEQVMVMVEDENLRANRLALLQKLLDDFSTIADFSEIVTERKAT